MLEEEQAKQKEQMEKRMHEIAMLAYQQAIDDFMRAMEYDIESVTRIAFDGCKDIFEGKKAQKFISDQITKAIKKQLTDKKFRM